MKTTNHPLDLVLAKFRNESISERTKGYRFEKLMQAYLKTEPTYTGLFTDVWLWSEFPYRSEFGGQDLGIDIVCRTHLGSYWAVQCKFYDEDAYIDKASVDSFLSTSSRTFSDDVSETAQFAARLWIATTDRWSSNAEETIRQQHPQVQRIYLSNLYNATVEWNKLAEGISGQEACEPKKQLREHQLEALTATHAYFKKSGRGKLIMACGTGKTFTSLKIAEHETQGRGLILFLVPSIALLGQTLREWSAQSEKPINSICICSDARASETKAKRRGGATFSDTGGDSITDLMLPASTDTKAILKQFRDIRQYDTGGMTVVFSTYQSIERISEAQKELLACGYPEFDLIICDEAHRTTGVTLKDDTDESNFVKVHNNDFIRAKKRLYMTATPKLYGDNAKSKADEIDAVLCSMDDENLYGQEIYRIGFAEAVRNGLLCDYKVLILTVSESEVPQAVQSMIMENEFKEIDTTDAAKLVGCINALSKQIIGDADLLKNSDPTPMHRAVAFCQTIAVSKEITAAFMETQRELTPSERETMVTVNSDHIDGSMNAGLREEKLNWLKQGNEAANECRILTNVRCLSEGVDVPSLDAVMFLSLRNSQIEVVQSVGRVMRIAEGKKYGYIIIPVVVPSYVEADVALDKNESFKTVWEVLQALRAHDDKFQAEINKIELNRANSNKILIGRPARGNSEFGDDFGNNRVNSANAEIVRQMTLAFEDMQSVIYGKIVKKVGEKRYWEQWARDVAQIAERHIEQIKRLIAEGGKAMQAFNSFLTGLRKNINPSVTESDAIEMLSQHIITKPVFEALFENYSFVNNNPISQSMQKVMELLEDQITEEENKQMERFYESVRMRAEKIDNAEGKQKVIIELYDKFFKTAFPKVVEKLGIVYTPVEVVDFINSSVDYILQKEFGRTLSDENVHILDPFTGTGTFITRLLQSGLISPEALERKYTREIHANEIVLLAYYIASINIENTYHDLKPGNYRSFDGICLTDTFQLGEDQEEDNESREGFAEVFPQNSKRVKAQRKAPIRIIIGNPPYSVGQKDGNDNAQNQHYALLESRIDKTYAKESNVKLKKSLKDSYFKAFRWASDRLDKTNGGVIAFVTNGAWIDSNAGDGFRKSIEKEFSSIYVFNLRGNQRTSGELSRKEGGKIFGSGSRTPIAITILVKHPQHNGKATIHYHDIGDYLSREDKLRIIKEFYSIQNPSIRWQILSPNEFGDWINKRSQIYDSFLPIGEKTGSSKHSFFNIYSAGVKTNRDYWCYNFSHLELKNNIELTIATYNEECLKYKSHQKEYTNINIENIITLDPTKISWSGDLLNSLSKLKPLSFNKKNLVVSLYRPFSKNHLYFDRILNNSTYQIPKLFPTPKHQNLVICTTGVGDNNFSVFISDLIPDLHLIGTAQCFPLYWYDDSTADIADLFSTSQNDVDRYTRRDGITDWILSTARKQYGSKVTKEDIFYYVYGILHSPAYRKVFAVDLKKMLPRLPLVDNRDDFRAFSAAGRALAELHLNYETIEPYKDAKVTLDPNAYINYRVEKMHFGKNGKEVDKSTIIYNNQITISKIPLKAYDYVLNGKSAIDWIMERYAVTTDNKSGIRNDPNDWAAEHNDEKYILNLLLRIITVSLETCKIVASLPKLKLE